MTHPETRSQLARLVDFTLLRPEATPADVERLCAEAGELGVHAVCVSASMVAVAAATLPPAVALATVAGFPSGAHTSVVKAREAAYAVEQGAVEVDMVLDLGRVKAGEWRVVEADVRAVRDACPSATLKVILETAALTADEAVAACRAAEAAGAQFVKTSTGFHPAGGASVDTVRLLARTVASRLGVKASGGIRSAPDALALLEAGATRLGVSDARAVLEGLPT